MKGGRGLSAAGGTRASIAGVRRTVRRDFAYAETVPIGRAAIGVLGADERDAIGLRGIAAAGEWRRGRSSVAQAMRASSRGFGAEEGVAHGPDFLHAIVVPTAVAAEWVGCANAGHARIAAARERHARRAFVVHASAPSASIVEDAVAIVVAAVTAHFADGENGLRTTERAARTRGRSIGTRADLSRYRTRSAATGIAIVDGAVAIVIDVVAGFRGW